MPHQNVPQTSNKRIKNTTNINESKHHIKLLQTLRKKRTSRGPVEKAKAAVEVANLELKMVMRYLEAPWQTSHAFSDHFRIILGPGSL
jgi:hypothetical protein